MRIKNFVKEHKKELISAAVAAGVTSFVFVKFGKRSFPKTPFVSLNVLAEVSNSEYFSTTNVNSGYFNIDLKDAKVKDFGKVGEQLISTFPKLEESTLVNNISVSYSFPIK
jgi:hypothetical protein